MKKNLVPLLGIAFVVALVATGIFYGLFVTRMESNPAGGHTQQIVAAARSLDRGTLLKPEDLKTIAWPAAQLPKGAFTSAGALKDATVLASLEENEPLVAARVATRDSHAAGLGIAPGMRAVSVRVSDSFGVINLLRSGHRVDVQLVTISGPTSELRTIVQNIEVLTVAASGDGKSTGPVVTLLATPLEADMLGLGDSAARLRLVLRNPGDEIFTTLPRQALGPMFQTPAPSRPARAVPK